MDVTIRQLLETQTGVGLCWTGNNGWLIGAAGHLVAFDLDFMSGERLSPPPLPMDAVAGALEWLLVTHWHGDHFNGPTCRALAEHGRCRFLLPESCRDGAREIGLPVERVVYVAPGMELKPEPWLRVRTVRAIHGHLRHSVYEHANLLDCGYLIDFNGLTIFEPGDTVLLQQHLELPPVDVLMVSPTEHNTHIEGSVAMIEHIQPRAILAQHFGTYHETAENSFWTHGYPDELLQALPQEFRGRFIKPVQGETIHIEGTH